MMADSNSGTDLQVELLDYRIGCHFSRIVNRIEVDRFVYEMCICYLKAVQQVSEL